MINYSWEVTPNLYHMFCVSPVWKHKILQRIYGLIILPCRNFVVFESKYLPQYYIQSRKGEKFHHIPGLDFQEKALVPAGSNIFRFSHQQKYFSEKCEKLVASEKNLVALPTSVVATSSSELYLTLRTKFHLVPKHIVS